MLQHLFVALRDYFSHPFHVFLARLHQSTQILFALLVYITRTQTKMIGKPIAKI
jgi:hypothetical protein